jgi:hypothetical protein
VKKVLSFILISLIIFANLFAPFNVGINQKNNIEINKNIASADGCTGEAAWDKNPGENNPNPGTLHLLIKTSDCAGGKINVILNETNQLIGNSPAIKTASPSNIVIANDVTDITYHPGEEYCSDGICKIAYTIYISDINGKGFTLKSPTDLVYKCSAEACNPNILWSFVLPTGTTLAGTSSFQITPSIKTKDTEALVTINVVNNTPPSDIIIAGATMRSTLSLNVVLKNKDGSEKETQKQELAKTGGVNSYSFLNLTASTEYKASISIIKNTILSPTGGITSNIDSVEATAPDVTIITNTSGNINLVDQAIIPPVTMVKSSGGDPAGMPSCGISFIGLGGCAAQIIYYVLFVPTSYLFALAGVFFDYTFAYSVQDSSYKSSFVVQGWGLVRDFCNLFFIFVLLYIAIGTILSLHGVKTKETIINVVIIGLFINFSLFATQVIIDASNIMARVFYNSNAIVITKGSVSGANTMISDVGPDGALPLSAALVSKVDPQNIIIHSEKVGNITDSTGKLRGASDTIGVGTFIMVTLLAVAVNLTGIVVFASVGLIFIARVIGLWLAMIMSPLAFFTYILPEQMAGWKMVGWKNWWPETLKMAFLAPVFIFFMYIILKFLELDLISDPMSKKGLSFLLASIIPFAFIMVLLMKAKSIAVDMSGEIGQQITSKLSTAGGLALGVATGGAALAMRGTVGRLGSAIANSERLKKYEAKGGFGGKTLRNLGSAAGKGSFDVRKTKAGATFSKETGIDMTGGGVIKTNEGGFVKARADKTAARQKRAKELELGVDSPEKIAQRKAEVALKELQNQKSHDISSIDGKLAGARQRVIDANSAVAAETDEYKKNKLREEAIKATNDVRRLNEDKNNIMSGGLIMKKDEDGNIIRDDQDKAIPDGTGRYHTTDGRISGTELKKINKKAEDDGAIASEAIQKELIIKGGNGIIGKADADEIDAINKAGAEKIAAIEKAAEEERSAIENSKLIVEKAKEIASEANRKAMLDPANIVLKTEADNAKTAYNNASINLNTITANAAATKAAATINAGKIESDAIAKAGLEKLAAIKKAEEERQDAIEKATQSEAGATAARASASTGVGKSMNEIQYHDIPHTHHAVDKINNERKADYANYIDSDFNKVLNMISSGGVHSSHGANEAADNIRLDLKIESSGGGHGGGHGGGGGHSAPAAPKPTTNKPTSSGGGNGGGGGHGSH